MSKAFTKEDDTREEILVRPPALGSSSANYITPDGADRFGIEFVELTEQRATIAAAGESLDGRRQLQQIDQRLSRITRLLQTAVVISAPSNDSATVRFGAFVTVRDGHGEVDKYRIVGVEEVDLAKGWISAQSPLAKALLNAKAGQTVHFKAPAGLQELQILSVSY